MATPENNVTMMMTTMAKTRLQLQLFATLESILHSVPRFARNFRFLTLSALSKLTFRLFSPDKAKILLSSLVMLIFLHTGTKKLS